MTEAELERVIAQCEKEIGDFEKWRKLRLEDADELTRDIQDSKARLQRLFDSLGIVANARRRRKR